MRRRRQPEQPASPAINESVLDIAQQIQASVDSWAATHTAESLDMDALLHGIEVNARFAAMQRLYGTLPRPKARTAASAIR